MKKVFICGQRENRLNYAAALEFCGLQPVFSTFPSDSRNCAALLLPGGGDLDPALYGQNNMGSRTIDRSLDERELELVRSFLQNGRPIFGICRGLQVLNVAFGGDLIQHLPTSAAHCWEEETGDKRHLVRVRPESFLHNIYGDEFFVNSAHHQGAGQIAKGFTVAARAGDGVTEALEWPEKKIYAVQWHPERMALAHTRQDMVDGMELFRFFAGQIP